MDDLLSEFLTETSENLAVLDVELVQLEQNPNDPDLLGNIFRLFHTIKGTCGFLGLPRLESVAHAAENVLDKFRDDEIEVTPDAVTLILESLDKIKDLIATLEELETEPEGDDKELISRLNALAEGKMKPGEAAELAPEPAGGPAAAPTEDVSAESVPAAVEAETESEAAPAAAAPAEGSGGGDNEELQALFNAARAEMMEYEAQADVEAADAEMDAKTATVGDSEEETDVAAVAAEPDKAVAEKSADSAKPAKSNRAGGGADQQKEMSVANQSIRVNVELLENLMTMVSELVLTRNQLLQIVRRQKDSDFTGPLQRLNHVVSELQEGVMKTRMQPIGNAWAKLPRIVRDLSQELGKKINLEMLGAETELDRQVLELIKDPLTHMVRNSGDHGIETIEDRLKAGKTEMGTIRLNAFHQGGHIVIEISDDGKGLNTDRIRAKVIENGLATDEELSGMTEQQIHQFIFKAGFSTAASVTSVSGRGVGMDVVRTNIERIGGTVELTSQTGKGSTFLIKIPLTLAIVSALVVECSGERFAIPQISVVELVRAGGSQSEHAVERLNGTPVLRLRDRLLPLVSLRNQLKLAGEEEMDAEGEDPVEVMSGKEDEDAFVVVTQVGNYAFGIIVDRVFDTEEIVVKPVSPILRNISVFSGNTILGDGSVIMILDPNGIAAATGEISVADDVTNEDAASIGRTSADQVALLLFNAGEGAPKAVPLALVARLEDIKVADMETSNDGIVVQYRGQLMPLIPYASNFSVERAQQEAEEGEGRKSCPVLVFADGNRQMGLIVDEIVDIVEQTMQVDLAAEENGILGSAIIADRATDVVDAGHYLTMAYQDWFAAENQGEENQPRKQVLLVDDSHFFRNMITPMLGIAGFEVTAVSSADEAMDLRERGRHFDVIVSDIEMPGTSGFQFAEMVKSNGAWAETPIVALSSHATPGHIARGRDVGFADYVSKSDRDAIVLALTETITDMRGAA
ncbi:MAG: chemotaxis protein CheW [Pseudomonadota bacterium]